MNTFIIRDSQYYKTDGDSPPTDYILEALSNVYDKIKDDNDTWICKGNYNFNFWRDTENKNTIYCNGFLLKNPDDFNDKSMTDYTYYFEIEELTESYEEEKTETQKFMEEHFQLIKIGF